MSHYREITRCRVCGNSNLQSLLDLGMQAMTGVFPRVRDQLVPVAPLHLVKCAEDKNEDACGLVQLKHSCDPGLMYGSNYGYRSGLNASMLRHLQGKAEKIRQNTSLPPGSLVVDIGSNDSSLLRALDGPGLQLVGIDPTGEKFRQFYPENIQLVPEFFSAARFQKEFGRRKAKVITSIAMFYDLEDPLAFVREVADILTDDGVWVFEQSYLPSMLATNSYDTICHEHLEYYGLRQIQYMLMRAGLKILSVETNAINGGSFSVTAAHRASSLSPQEPAINAMVNHELGSGLRDSKVYIEFRERVFEQKARLQTVVHNWKHQGKKLAGYGASTKGNVILQFCGFGADDIPFIAEVNSDKYGCFTPGTLIPIISEEEARNQKPDGFVVLPWHFREHVVRRERDFLDQGGGLIFPLPLVDVVAAN